MTVKRGSTVFSASYRDSILTSGPFIVLNNIADMCSVLKSDPMPKLWSVLYLLLLCPTYLQSARGDTPLYIACNIGNLNIVNILISHKVKLDFPVKVRLLICLVQVWLFYGVMEVLLLLA